MNEYVSITSLATFGGMLAILNLVVQFLKPKIDNIKKINTRYVVFVIALILMVVVQVVTGDFTFENIVLLFLNSIVLTLAAMGSYELVIKPREIMK